MEGVSDNLAREHCNCMREIHSPPSSAVGAGAFWLPFLFSRGRAVMATDLDLFDVEEELPLSEVTNLSTSLLPE